MGEEDRGQQTKLERKSKDTENQGKRDQLKNEVKSGNTTYFANG